MNEQTPQGAPTIRPVGRYARHNPRLMLARLVWIALVGLTLCVVAGSIAAIVAGQGRPQGSIGVDYGWTAAAELVLWPYPGEPAAEAGVTGGEVLVAVNGTPVPAGLSMDAARRRLEGPIGASIAVTTRASDGAMRQYALTRTEERTIRAARRLGIPPAFGAIYFPLLEIALMLTFLAAGLVLALRRFDDWFLLFASLGLVLQAPHFSFASYLLWQMHPGWLWALDLINVLANICSLLIFYLFPTGRFVPRWTPPLAVGYAAWVVVQFSLPGVPLSLGHSPEWLQNLAYLGWYGTGIAAQVYRYRRVSGPVQRQQTKWVVLGLCVAVLGY